MFGRFQRFDPDGENRQAAEGSRTVLADSKASARKPHIDVGGGSRVLSKSATPPTAVAVAAPARLREANPAPTAAPTERKVDRLEYRGFQTRLQQELVNYLDPSLLTAEDEEPLIEAVKRFAADAVFGASHDKLPLTASDRGKLANDLRDAVLSVGPLAPLLIDPAVTDIMVNSARIVYVERFGKLEKTNVEFRDDAHLIKAIKRIGERMGRRVDEAVPLLDARLPDGSRVNATIPPATIDGPSISIRRFGRRRLRREDLERLGSATKEMMLFLEHAVKLRKNIVVSGGTGSGKSTLLGAIAEAIPDDERIVTIEDAAELILDQEHVVRMETRPPNLSGFNPITARDLVINCLRMRPDRIIVGEVRGGEAADMLQAMNTGHDGSMTTIHANTPRDAISRLETLVLMAGLELPARAIREQIVSAVHMIVQVRRFEDGVRRVSSITEVLGMEGNVPVLQEIFAFRRQGREGRKIIGEYAAQGVVPSMMEELRERDIPFPAHIFKKKF